MPSQIRTAIIDDHPMIRDGVALALANTRDISVVADGSTGPEAMSIAQRLLPDVMLLDINLPGGGFEAATAITRRTPTVRIIILEAVLKFRDMDNSVEPLSFAAPDL